MRLIPPNRKTKYWNMEIMVDGEKVKRSTYTTSETVALEKLEQYEKAAAARETMRLLKQDAEITIPVRNLWQMYMATNPTCYSDDLKRRQNRIKAFVKWLTAHKINDINKITPRIADRYAQQVLIYKTGTKEKSINKTYNDKVKFSRHFFRKIFTETDLKENPFTYVELKPQHDSKHGRPFTPDEIIRILTRCLKKGKEWYELTLLAIYTGMRYVDCCFIKWTDIDEMEIDGEIQKIVTITPRKTRKYKTKQILVIPEDLEPMLKAQKAKGSKYILPLRHKLYRPKQNSAYNEEILTPLGIIDTEEYKIWFHCTRHTCATKIKAVGGTEKDALSMTGLTNASTLETYQDKDVKNLVQIANKIHFELPKPPPLSETDLKHEE